MRSRTARLPGSPPKTLTRPVVGCVWPSTIDSSVVLPAPFGPRMLVRPPAWICRDTVSSATVSP